MTQIPKVTVQNSSVYKATLNYKGDLCNNYSPLYNLVDKDTKTLKDFTTEQLNFDLNHPVDILVQESYDGSVNLILNDDKNPPKLVNSRFSVQEDNTFIIPDHRGFKDTNVYSEETFDADTFLKPVVLQLPKVIYEGAYENQGNLKCGTYTFYFKLSDADGNESEVIAESGIVPVHIGTPNNPSEIRMGVQDENSKKSVQFKLTNLDAGFDYIHVLYARSSSGNDLATVHSYYKIEFDYPIQQGQCIIHITGNEHTTTIEQNQLYVDYADLQSVKTQTECANVLMFGNVSKPYHDYDELQRIAWKIIPKPVVAGDNFVGHINVNYKDSNTQLEEDSKLCYYNSKNVYYRLGYWPDEIYRFGIVYIFKDNSLSPVFNIQGIDFSKADVGASYYAQAFFQNGENAWECSTEDSFLNKSILINNNEQKDISSWKLNSKGVIKFDRTSVFGKSKDSILQPTPLGIQFDFSHVHKKSYNDVYTQDLFELHGIKGFFFVRQKRIPTIIGQGVAIGVTDKEFGSIPTIKNPGGQFIAESFLGSDRLIYSTGTMVNIPEENVKVRGLLVPDAEICDGVYNDILVGNDYCLDKVGEMSFTRSTDYHYHFKHLYNKDSTKYITSLLNVPEDISIISNGEDFFSTVAGSPSEPYKTIDIKHAWKRTVPQILTESTTLVRGKFGAFVGMGSPTHDGKFPFKYGEIYNIKEKRYAEDEDAATMLDFQRRFNDFSEYKSICDRTEVIKDTITCYRGDCFPSMFTHRMHRNFIDPELPTNKDIIDPACWAANYGVRCTAAILTGTHSNLTDDADGWVIPAPADQPWVQALIYFLTGNIFGAIKELAHQGQQVEITPEKLGLGSNYKYINGEYYLIEYQYDSNGNIKKDSSGNPVYTQGAKFDPNNLEQLYPNGYANEIVQAFEVYIGQDEKGSYLRAKQKKKKVNPKQQETTSTFDFKAIFKADEDWDLRGLANINRADVNAVGIGHWITFPICSSRNLAFRDIDYSNATEQASFNRKRSFYPLFPMLKQNPLQDSNIVNAATSISIPHKPYFGITDYRFLKQEYFTRVYNSLTDSSNTFTNEYKQLLELSFQDYTKKCGSITKMLTVNNMVYIVFEHGIGQVTFQPTHAGQSPEMMQDVILLRDDIGSIWKDSVIIADDVIFGVDSVAKKIWRIANKQFQIISDFKVQKFLVDNLDMSEYTTSPYLGHINIKTHYNAFKNDVIFTYYNDIPKYENGVLIGWEEGKIWSLCYNMVKDTFITFYDWCPIESVNIDNVYFSFDRDRFNKMLDPQGVPEKIVIQSHPTESSQYAKFTNDITSYQTKKFNIDNSFNHIVVVYNMPKGNYINVYTKDKDKRVISFYFKGKIKLLHDSRDIKPPYISDTWKHITIILPEQHTKQSQLQLLSLDDSTEITEIAFYPVSTYKVIQDYYNTQTSLVQNNTIIDFPEKELLEDKNDKINLYNIRNTQDQLFLWKHGQSGVYDIQGVIKPTNWYGKQHVFSFEFVVTAESGTQKIFNNLKIISNKTEPYKFEYEIVGEGYEWFELKPVIKWINDKASVDKSIDEWYIEILSNTYEDLRALYPDFPILNLNKEDRIYKLPYLILEGQHAYTESNSDNDYEHTNNSSGTTLIYDKRQNDYNVRTTQLGNNIRRVGRAKGNMQYLEDLWDVEIRPITFKYAYVDNNQLLFTQQKETRHRDKYLKVKVCYSGENLAVIQAIQTTFDFSYA